MDRRDAEERLDAKIVKDDDAPLIRFGERRESPQQVVTRVAEKTARKIKGIFSEIANSN